MFSVLISFYYYRSLLLVFASFLWTIFLSTKWFPSKICNKIRIHCDIWYTSNNILLHRHIYWQVHWFKCPVGIIRKNTSLPRKFQSCFKLVGTLLPISLGFWQERVKISHWELSPLARLYVYQRVTSYAWKLNPATISGQPIKLLNVFTQTAVNMEYWSWFYVPFCMK